LRFAGGRAQFDNSWNGLLRDGVIRAFSPHPDPVPCRSTWSAPLRRAE